MNAPDIRTIILINLLTDFVCVLLMFNLWIQNRRRYHGLTFWLFDFILQTLALGFIFLRGIVPDWISLLLANSFIIIGALLGFIGLKRFAGIRGSMIINYLIFALFLVFHFYFSLVRPTLDIRNLNLTVVLFIICLQCSWLVLRQADRSKRSALAGVGAIYVLFCLTSGIRILIILQDPARTNDFFKSDAYDGIILITFQVLLLLLAYYQVLAVNKTLFSEVLVQEDKFTKAFHSSPFATVLTHMADGKIIEVNDGFVNMTGYSREEVIGIRTTDLNLWVREVDRDLVINKLAKDHKIRNSEQAFRKKSGEQVIGLFSADLITIDGQVLILSNINDITNRKEEELKQQELLVRIERDRRALLSILEDNRRIHESLSESEARYRSIFESANVGKSITLPTGEISVNAAFCRMLGYSPGELRSKRWQDLTPEEEIEPIMEIMAPVYRGEKDTARFEKRYIHKNGDIIWGDISTAMLRSASGEGNYFITTVVDITERKKAEAAVQQLNTELEQRVRDRTAQLEESNRELEAFSYSVSHDLRAPLRHITGYVDLMKHSLGENLPDDASHYMSVISESAKRMGLLIDDLLQFSRMGRKELLFSEVPMGTLVDEIVGTLNSEAGSRTVEWDIQELPDVQGDLSLLRQVWINLLENAFKFTKHKPHSFIKVGFSREDDHFVFHVRDNGAGFDMNYAGKLFGVFQRMHLQTEFEGTGIGLANVKRIITRHGGRVWAEARPGLGATFYFSLPIKKD